LSTLPAMRRLPRRSRVRASSAVAREVDVVRAVRPAVAREVDAVRPVIASQVDAVMPLVSAEERDSAAATRGARSVLALRAVTRVAVAEAVRKEDRPLALALALARALAPVARHRVSKLTVF